MRRRAYAALWVLIGVSLVLAPSVAAHAAESPAAAGSDVEVSQHGVVDVQFWMEEEPGAAVAIVSVTLDPSVALPATVRVPVPEGMTVDWAGEIADSGSIDDDIKREFETKSGSGGSYAEFELTTYRVGQVDLGAAPISVSGNKVEGEFRYVQSVPASETAFSVRVPGLASDVDIAPAPVGSPRVNEIGQALYTLPSTSLKVGETRVVTVSYEAGSLGDGSRGSDPLDMLLWVLVAGSVIFLGALVWLVARGRGRSSGSVDIESQPGSGRVESTGGARDALPDDADEPFSIDE